VDSLSLPNDTGSLELQMRRHTENSRSVSWTQSSPEQLSALHATAKAKSVKPAGYLLTASRRTATHNAARNQGRLMPFKSPEACI
jgi:hypothetical protein